MKAILKVWILAFLLLNMFSLVAQAKDNSDLVPNIDLQESFKRSIEWREALAWENEKEQYLMKEGKNAHISFEPKDSRILYFLGDKYRMTKENYGAWYTKGQTNFHFNRYISEDAISVAEHAKTLWRESEGFELTVYDVRNPKDIMMAFLSTADSSKKPFGGKLAKIYIVYRIVQDDKGDVYEVSFTGRLAIGNIPVRRGIYQAIKRTPAKYFMKDWSSFRDCVFGAECYE